ncbi:hypothetical protein O6H91_05G091400 [Diphasiastrum complanatum]|uniref:Uncharacterized protein n=3 Tax=Diphasiastrum complanatum TaxID=34168 RepID=A0ACC2DR71_DIPCM|nr:hypothetical protein O6H91_05G091400 [Diphasiastrum complanatum]KAJ7556640.1 hypothetical protein O6H91_05G091400 [Diphasiastrum complanatum]
MKTRRSSISNKSTEEPAGLASNSRQEVDKLLDRRSATRSSSKWREASEPTSGVRSTRRRLLRTDNVEENLSPIILNHDICRQHTDPAETPADFTQKKLEDHTHGQNQDYDKSFSKEPYSPVFVAESSADDIILENDYCKSEVKEDISEDDGFDWEVGEHLANTTDAAEEDWNGEVNVTLEETGRKTERQQGRRLLRRATAKDKEFAEFVHKAHLLCLIARGRVVDASCEDPLLQGVLISLLPSPLADTRKYSTDGLVPIVTWFKKTFSIISANGSSSTSNNVVSLRTCLFHVVEKQVGLEEEIAALSVALFRAIGFITRYVTVVDVASLKPDAVSLEASVDWDQDRSNGLGGYVPSVDYWGSKTASLGQILARCAPSWLTLDQGKNQTSSVEQQFQDCVGEGSLERKKGHQQPQAKGKRGATQSLGDDANQSRIKITRTSYRGRGRRAVSQCHRIDSGTSSAGLLENVSTTDLLEGNGSARKGDREFELQLAMAMAATAAASTSKLADMHEANNAAGSNLSVNNQNKGCSEVSLPLAGTGQVQSKTPDGAAVYKHRNTEEEASGLIWSRKMGPIVHWAEVFCGGEGTTGRWVHVDAARGIIDDAKVVESAAGICKLPLRYVLAFAGSGVKDVTRRYVSLWSKAVPHRVDQVWLDATLSPLRQLEAAATTVMPVDLSMSRAGTSGKLQQDIPKGSSIEGSIIKATEHQSVNCKADSGALEDMELETRALTEPLPTNQLAYKTHHLYVLERWLTKYQVLHPKGPVLGYCAGQPVYPRTCVQNLHTADRWLQEGFRVNSGEAPVKVVKASRPTLNDPNLNEVEVGEKSPNSTMTQLFGKWQTEVWHPPPAADGIVPKNSRGNVDVWSEKCLPPGTVHLRLPRLFPVARRLGIDYAPAMVGFEIHNRRSMPVFDGIVVCQEFKEAILEAYAEEEESRTAETQKKRVDQAAVRWHQLLRAIITRQRLRAAYENVHSDGNKLGSIDVPVVEGIETSKSKSCTGGNIKGDDLETGDYQRALPKARHYTIDLHHTHDFPEEIQSFHEESGIRTKRCSCGFTVEVEEM